MMTRLLPIAIVAALIAAGVVISLSVGPGGGTEAQESTPVIHPSVWEALEVANEVQVFVALREAETPLLQTTEERKAYSAAIQERVLGVLTPDEFTLGTRFKLSPAFSGWITEAGVLTLQHHPDVIGIEVPVPGDDVMYDLPNITPN